jgi:hypothetical protein
MIHEGEVPSVQCEVNLRWYKSMREVDVLNFFFNVPALAPSLNRIDTALQLRRSGIYRRIIGKRAR